MLGSRGSSGGPAAGVGMSLRDSRGPGKAGWVPVLGSSSPQLGDVTSGSLGVEVPGEPCRRPQARPRTQVQAHGALQPTIYTQGHTHRYTPALSLPSSQDTVTPVPSQEPTTPDLPPCRGIQASSHCNSQALRFWGARAATCFDLALVRLAKIGPSKANFKFMEHLYT